MPDVSICMLLTRLNRTHSQHLITKKDNLCQGLDSITDCLDCFYWLNKFLFLDETYSPVIARRFDASAAFILQS